MKKIFSDHTFAVVFMILGLLLGATGSLLDDWTLVPSWWAYSLGGVLFAGGFATIVLNYNPFKKKK